MIIQTITQSQMKLLGRSFKDKNEALILGIIDSESIRRIAPRGDMKFYQAKVAVPRSSGFNDVLPIIFSGEIYKLKVRENLNKDILLIGSYKTQMLDEPMEEGDKLFQYIEVENADPDTDFYQLEHNNSIHLKGTICKPPRYKELPLSTLYQFCLAVNDTQANYIPCTCKGDYSNYFRNLNVGDRIEVLGRMATREYKRADQNICTTYEMRINKIEAIEYK